MGVSVGTKVSVGGMDVSVGGNGVSGGWTISVGKLAGLGEPQAEKMISSDSNRKGVKNLFMG